MKTKLRSIHNLTQKYLCVFFDEQDKIDSYILGILTYKTNPTTIYISYKWDFHRFTEVYKVRVIRYLIFKYKVLHTLMGPSNFVKFHELKM